MADMTPTSAASPQKLPHAAPIRRPSVSGPPSDAAPVDASPAASSVGTPASPVLPAATASGLGPPPTGGSLSLAPQSAVQALRDADTVLAASAVMLASPQSAPSLMGHPLASALPDALPALTPARPVQSLEMKTMSFGPVSSHGSGGAAAASSSGSPADRGLNLSALAGMGRTELYAHLATQMGDPASFATRRYGAEQGPVVLSALSALTPNCTALLVDPGVCSKTHLAAFARFVAEQPEPFRDAFTARQAFSDTLGTVEVFLGVCVEPGIAKDIASKHGFQPKLFREMQMVGFAPERMPSRAELLERPMAQVVMNHLKPGTRVDESVGPVHRGKAAFMALDLKDFQAAIPAARKEMAELIPQLIGMHKQALERVQVCLSKGDAAGAKVATEDSKKIERYIKPLMISDKNLAAVKAPILKNGVNAQFLASATENIAKAKKELLSKPELTRQAALQSFSLLPEIAIAVTNTPAFNGGVTPTAEKPVFIMTLQVPKLDLIDPADYLPRGTDMPDIRVQGPSGGPRVFKNDKAVESIMLGGIQPSAIKSVQVDQSNLIVLPES